MQPAPDSRPVSFCDLIQSRVMNDLGPRDDEIDLRVEVVPSVLIHPTSGPRRSKSESRGNGTACEHNCRLIKDLTVPLEVSGFRTL